jgi:hypothetical protein
MRYSPQYGCLCSPYDKLSLCSRASGQQVSSKLPICTRHCVSSKRAESPFPRPMRSRGQEATSASALSCQLLLLALEFAVQSPTLYTLVLPPNTPCLAVENFLLTKNKSEVLFASNAKWVVTKDPETKNGVLHIHARYVEHVPLPYYDEKHSTLSFESIRLVFTSMQHTANTYRGHYRGQGRPTRRVVGSLEHAHDAFSYMAL